MREIKFISLNTLKYIYIQLGLFALIILVCQNLFPVSFFINYYRSFPIVVIITYLIMGTQTIGNFSNTALSCGATRKNLLIAIHVSTILATAIGFLLCWILSLFDSNPLSDQTTIFMFEGANITTFTVAMFLAQILGYGISVVMSKSRIWGGIVIFIVIIAVMGILGVATFSQITHTPFWGDILPIVVSVSVALAIISEIFFISHIKRMQVR